MANLVVPPYDIYADANGDPLEDGYVYIGIAGLSPINSPLQAYWDSALSIPANNIRTKGGYPSNSGTPGRLYTAANYSILVQDKRNVTVYTQLDSVDYINSASGSLIALVDTIADLRGLALASQDDQASVGGSVTVGDGLMGPLYYWSATSSAVDNGVSIIKPTATVGNGRWLWINTNAPMETVNISASSTLELNFLNRLFLVDTALAIILAVPDGDFQGQDIQLANRGVSTLGITGTGIPVPSFVVDEVLLTWLGTQWSISYRGVFSSLTIGDTLFVDIIEEKTAAAGVTVESVLLKDDTVTAGTSITTPLVVTDEITEVTADAGVGVQASSGEILFEEVVDLPVWDMDTTDSITIDVSPINSNKIKIIQVFIKNDASKQGSDTPIYDLTRAGFIALTDGGGDVVLTREAAGFFDSTSYDDSDFSRGYMSLIYAKA